MNFDHKNMKRNRPQQPYYKPGSGSLRKSNSGIEESESDTNLLISSKQTQPKNAPQVDSRFRSEGNSPRSKAADMDNTVERFGDMSIRDSGRKYKKPDQEIYVPPPVIAQSKDPHEVANERDKYLAYPNGNERRYEPNNDRGKSKRYSNQRRGNDNRQYEDDWGDKPNFNNRQLRQTSEPRTLNNANMGWQKMRDNRNNEQQVNQNHNFGGEKGGFQKPPSGRRHSVMGVDRMNELPPRFRKKMEEGKIKGPCSDDWDGSSITFQGSNIPSTFPRNMNYQAGSYATLPSNHSVPPPNMPGNMYSTLPNRGRGRSRLMHEHYEAAVGLPYNRPVNSDMSIRSPCDSRPTSPSGFNQRFRSTECLNRLDHPRPPTPNFYPKKNDYTKNFERAFEDKFNKHAHEDRCRRNISDRGDRRFNDDRMNRRVNNDDTGCKNDDSRHYPPRGRPEQGKPFIGDKYITPPKPQFRPSLEAQLTSISPEPLKEMKEMKTIGNDSLDWGEEVEQNYKLETEALSDALTRSSSVASLVETSTKSMPIVSNSRRKSKKKSGRKNKRRTGSTTRDSSYERSNHRGSQPHDSKDNFRTPHPPRQRRMSRDRRDSSYEKFNRSRNHSRERSFDRHNSKPSGEPENWREEIRSRQNSEREIRRSENNSDRSRNNSESHDLQNIDVKKAGVLVLQKPESSGSPKPTPPISSDHPRFPEVRNTWTIKQKSLFDPNNPNKPIIVKSPGSRVSAPGFSDNNEVSPPSMQITTDQFGNIQPNWYNENSEEFKMSHCPTLIQGVVRADNELQCLMNSGFLLQNWDIVEQLWTFLKEALQYLLCKDFKFSQTANVEQHFWKLLYYNIIELTRKAIVNDPTKKSQFKTFLLFMIDDGNKFYENLLNLLEETYHFKINDLIGVSHSGLGFVGLGLISAQKLFIYLGDLARYREQINETTNYGKCRQYYIKAHEINPKNGKPYNQLALLAVYARRKLDAVYYYMRSLMSSNPIPSARESLISLLDENRKKYEQGERKRREERLQKAKEHMKEKESDTSSSIPGSIRREIWIRPDGGKRVHRTTQAIQKESDSEEEDLASLSSAEVNKRFVVSYLHVHGKLINKTGMESFNEASLQMLKEFRTLLQHSPFPIPQNRLLQLLALNMFAIESTQLKDPTLQQQNTYRSELQERALVISLQMFSLILERCISLIQEHLNSNPDYLNSLPLDANTLLPPIKIWCDWMLCHSSIWNPPPSTQDFQLGTPADTWARLAILMNLLEQLDQSIGKLFANEQRPGYELLRLPEDSVLSGFTPLMVNLEEPTYVSEDVDLEQAQFVLRLTKLLFFGTEFLCGLEPPVLKLEIEDEFTEYVSVVNTSSSRDSPESAQELVCNNEVLMESFSEDEDCDTQFNVSEDTSSEVRDLLTRKVELEKRHRNQQLHLQRVKKILSQSIVSVQIEVRPKYLVPDTNCFIDHLDRIASLASSPLLAYTFLVPIIVLGELEGLSKGGKYPPMPSPRTSLDPTHVKRVGECARRSLEFLKTRHANVKCVTTKGAVFVSTTFTTEDESTTNCNVKNDDKILSTCLILCKTHGKDCVVKEGEPRRLTREVVLLTDDRNLRVKALARDVPVREFTDFIKWAGLG